MDNILKRFDNIQLLKELLSREEQEILPPLPPIITPYYLIRKMIKNKWQEDPRIKFSDFRITRIWKYLGFPDYDDAQSYCAATVNACLKLAGYKCSRSIPVARSFEGYGEAIEHQDVEESDIIVFKRIDSDWRGHVGFVKEIDFKQGTVTVAGGNQNNGMNYKNYNLKGKTGFLEVSAFRRITEKEKIGTPDYSTIEKWGLL